MSLTAKHMEQYFRQRLLESELGKEVGGEVYFRGTVPRDKGGEYAVVMFVGGLPGQMETGIICVNIFVPDIIPFNDGVPMEDMVRTSQLEDLAEQWVKSVRKRHEYYIELAGSIHTVEDLSRDYHFVSVRINYKYCNS